MKNNYPFKKVIIGFTLCPVFPGFLWCIFVIFKDLNSESLNPIYSSISTILVAPFIMSLAGVLLFGIPSFFASLIYARLKLYKGWCNYILVMVVGGFSAYVRARIMWGGNDENFKLINVSFVLGVLCSLIMAYLVLPKKES